MMEDSENNKTNFQHQLPEKCHKARALVQSLNRKVGDLSYKLHFGINEYDTKNANKQM